MFKFRAFWQNKRWALVLSSGILLLILGGVLTQAAAAEVTANVPVQGPEDDPLPETPLPPAPTVVPPLPEDYWSYTVKFVCEETYEHQRNTIINIFNPSHSGSVMVMGEVITVSGPAVLRPPTNLPTSPLVPFSMVLPGLSATAIDCEHLFLPTTALTEGFVNIASAKPLDIVAVYMSSFQYGTDEAPVPEDENVEVEHVPGRYVIGGEAQPNGWEQP